MPPAPPLRKKIAQRINALLQHELGQGIDAKRMLAQPVYARDVLLVCDAMRDSDLALLAQQFRAASDVDDEPPSQPASLSPDSKTPPSLWPSSWFGAARRPRK